LAAIRDLCAADASGRSLTDVLGGNTSVAIDEGAIAYTAGELSAAVPAMANRQVRAMASDAELIRLEGSKWHVRAPALLALVGDVIDAGASPASAMRMAAGMAQGARMQASALADLVVDELWSTSASNLGDAVSFSHRARSHLTKATASLFMHQVGLELRARAALPGGEGLDELVDGLSVGVVRGREAGA